MIVRYAICFNRGTDSEFYYCQGSPKDKSLAFAIFYATREYAEKALKTAISRSSYWSNHNPEIVEVKCEVL